MKEKNTGTILLSVLQGGLAAIALSASGIYYQDSSSVWDTFFSTVNSIGADKFFLSIAFMILFLKTAKKYEECRHWTVYVLSALFSGFMLIGLSYSQNGNWSFILGGRKQMCIAFLVFAGFFLLFCRCLKMIYYYLNRVVWKGHKDGRHFPAWMEKHYFGTVFLILFCCWLPYLIAFWPGSVPYDGYRQINMALGIETLTNQHSWSLTMLMGVLMKLGRHVSDNFGVFLIVLTLALVEAFCYAAVCRLIKKWQAPFWMNVVSILFFAICPVFGAYAQTVMKDGIFMALFALYMAVYVDVCIAFWKQRNIPKIKRQLFYLFLLSFLLSIVRNNGIYLAFPAAVFLLFFVPRGKKRFVLVMISGLLISFYGYKNILTPYAGVKAESKRAMFSIPFQQTARYLKEYPEDVTESEKEAISRILKYEKLAELYSPEDSDPVKNTYRNSASREDLVNYLKAWFSMFQRHPGVYLEATLHNTFGYYYPFYQCTILQPYQFYIKGKPIATGELDIHYAGFQKARTMLSKWAYLWQNVPILTQLMNPGIYIWILLLMAGYFIYRRRWRSILVLAAPVLNMLVCVASPINGYLRYAMPVLAVLPVLVCWCMESRNELTKEETAVDGTSV